MESLDKNYLPPLRQAPVSPKNSILISKSETNHSHVSLSRFATENSIKWIPHAPRSNSSRSHSPKSAKNSSNDHSEHNLNTEGSDNHKNYQSYHTSNKSKFSYAPPNLIKFISKETSDRRNTIDAFGSNESRRNSMMENHQLPGHEQIGRHANVNEVKYIIKRSHEKVSAIAKAKRGKMFISDLWDKKLYCQIKNSSRIKVELAELDNFPQGTMEDRINKVHQVFVNTHKGYYNDSSLQSLNLALPTEVSAMDLSDDDIKPVTRFPNIFPSARLSGDNTPIIERAKLIRLSTETSMPMFKDYVDYYSDSARTTKASQSKSKGSSNQRTDFWGGVVDAIREDNTEANTENYDSPTKPDLRKSVLTNKNSGRSSGSPSESEELHSFRGSINSLINKCDQMQERFDTINTDSKKELKAMEGLWDLKKRRKLRRFGCK